MKLLLKIPYEIAGVRQEPNKSIEVPDILARQLIDTGIARNVRMPITYGHPKKAEPFAE